MANTKSSSKKEQVKTSNSYIRYFFSLFLILVGFLFFFYAAYSNFDFRLNINSQRNTSTQELQSKPLKIYIPQLGRTLYVSDGEVAGDRWATSPTNVSYLTSSAVPGASGNAVMYGHNTIGVLGGLWRVQEGDDIYVVMNDGQFYKYQVFDRREIDPSQVDILSQTLDSRLTIYTCSGFLDSARFVLVSKLQTS